MAVTTIGTTAVTFSNSTAAASLASSQTAGLGGATSLFSFDVLKASGGGAKASLWSVDDGVKGDDNPAVTLTNKAFAGYNSDLLWQDAANTIETSAKGAHFWFDATGKVQYDASPIASTIAALAAGEVFTDTIQYTIRLANGTLSVGSLAISITGVDDLAVIQAGGDKGDVTEDSTSLGRASGNLQSTDVDGPGDLWSAVTLSGTGHHGTFTMNAAGEWTYQLDNSDSAVNALDTGQSLSDTFTVTTADGQSKDVVITIHGATDVVPDPNDHDGLGSAGDNLIVDHRASSTLYGGAGSDTIWGNDGDDAIYGGSGDDTLHGNAGNDVIYGGSGNDTIYGEVQKDVLIGGLGADTISGGFGVDTFAYLGIDEGGDTIVDFTHNQDKIDLHLLDADAGTAGEQAFAWGGTTAAAHSLWYQYDALATNPDGSTGAVFLYADVNGDTTADFQIQVQGHPVLTASDFVL